METYSQFQAQKIQEIIPESQSELLARILPVAVALKEGEQVGEVELTEFSYLVKMWRDREVLWAQYPARLLACKTMGDLVDYLCKRYQTKDARPGCGPFSTLDGAGMVVRSPSRAQPVKVYQ